MALPSQDAKDKSSEMSEQQDKEAGLNASTNPQLSEFPAIIQSIRKTTFKHLQTNIKQLFTSIDDAMFEYADKADSNQQQTSYFEAMRQLRLEKKPAAQLYFKVFDKYFSDALRGVKHHGSSADDGNEEFSYSSLSLLEEDDLEESLAFTNMIEKSYGLYREYLQAIVQRLNHVIEAVEITSDNNPVSPDNICRAFEQAAEKFTVDLEVKLIVYKLFEKQVAVQLEEMYKEINEQFISAGILPTIKFKGPVKSQEQKDRSQVKSESVEAPKNQSATPKVSSGESGDVSFDSLRQLLSMQRGQSGEAAGQADGSTGSEPGQGGGVGGTGGGVYVTDDVLSGLTQLQGDFMDAAVAGQKYASVAEIKENLLSALSKDEDGNPKAIENDESDVIDIVSMMFEFILEDKTLSDRIRAEIARLQIPVIKVAILDKKFFDQQSHPARLLLNELAYAGTAFDTQEQADDDAIFQKVEYVVNRVLSEFQTNVTIFDELLEEFKQFIDEELQNNKSSEKVLEQTKQRVSDEMEKRIREYRVPKLVYTLLVDKWKEVLTVVGMKHGCKGPTWAACLDVVDDLIWSVQPKLMASERQALTKLIPKIIKRLREGLKLISVDDVAIQELLDQLGTLHLNCLKGTTDFTPRSSATEIPDTTRDDDDFDFESDGNPFAEELGDFEYFAGTDDFSEIKLSPESKRSKNHAVVRDLEMGTWVEFINDDKSKRGKLSWKCDFTGDYTFVDRRYRLVADISMDEFIKRMDKGSAVVVTELPLLDRAIDAVVNTMTKYLESANKMMSSSSS